MPELALRTVSETLSSLLAAPQISYRQIAAYVDGLSPETRVLETQALSRAEQKRLWELCEEAPPLTVEDLLPSTTRDGETVIYAGKNSLPLFTHFEKRFSRFSGKVYGYNQAKLIAITGPGYYSVGKNAQGEMLFDYTDVPPQGAAGWPKVRSNSRGISFFVYRNLHDYNRRVGKGVIIGYATRLGRPMNSYYVLARR